jgi:hypothetical protein
MPNRKEPREMRADRRRDGKYFSESSPNPHGENKVLEMPIRTHQKNETIGKNIGQVPNTIGGNLNPSVAHEFKNRAVSGKNAPDKRARAPKPIRQEDA